MDLFQQQQNAEKNIINIKLNTKKTLLTFVSMGTRTPQTPHDLPQENVVLVLKQKKYLKHGYN